MPPEPADNVYSGSAATVELAEESIVEAAQIYLNSLLP